VHAFLFGLFADNPPDLSAVSDVSSAATADNDFVGSVAVTSPGQTVTLISTRNRIAPYFGATIEERYEQVLYVCGLARVKAVVASVCIHPSPSEAPAKGKRSANHILAPSMTAW
jgi:hypothetical protein